MFCSDMIKEMSKNEKFHFLNAARYKKVVKHYLNSGTRTYERLLNDHYSCCDWHSPTSNGSRGCTQNSVGQVAGLQPHSGGCRSSCGRRKSSSDYKKFYKSYNNNSNAWKCFPCSSL